MHTAEHAFKNSLYMIKVDEMMSKGDTSANMQAVTYDNKVYIDSYKRDRY